MSIVVLLCIYFVKAGRRYGIIRSTIGFSYKTVMYPKQNLVEKLTKMSVFLGKGLFP